MSEQNKDLEKNYPGSGGAGNEINSQGGFVSGDIKRLGVYEYACGNRG